MLRETVGWISLVIIYTALLSIFGYATLQYFQHTSKAERRDYLISGGLYVLVISVIGAMLWGVAGLDR